MNDEISYIATLAHILLTGGGSSYVTVFHCVIFFLLSTNWRSSNAEIDILVYLRYRKIILLFCISISNTMKIARRRVKSIMSREVSFMDLKSNTLVSVCVCILVGPFWRVADVIWISLQVPVPFETVDGWFHCVHTHFGRSIISLQD